MSDLHSHFAQHGDFTVNRDSACAGARGDSAFNGNAALQALVSSSPRRDGGGNGCGGGIPGSGKQVIVLPSGNLNKLHVKHDNVAHCLAPRPPPAEDRELKSRVFEDAVATIRGSSEADWGAKTQFLCNRMQLPACESMAKEKVSDVKDVRSACFAWTCKAANAENGAALDIATAPNFDLLRCVIFNAAIDPTQPLADVVSDHKPAAIVREDVVVRAAVDPATGNPCPGCTAAILGDFRLFAAHESANNREAFIGDCDAASRRFSAEAWTAWVKKLFDQCAFESAAHFLRDAHVGEGAHLAAETRLNALRQQEVVNGRQHVFDVATCFERFVAIVNELPEGTRFPNLSAVFVQSLVAAVRNKMLSDFGCTIPAAAMPANHEEMVRLGTAKSAAIRAEASLTSVVQTAQMVISPNRPARRGQGAFMAAALMAPGGSGNPPNVSFDEGAPGSNSGACTGFPGAPSAPGRHTGFFPATSALNANPNFRGGSVFEPAGSTGEARLKSDQDQEADEAVALAAQAQAHAQAQALNDTARTELADTFALSCTVDGDWADVLDEAASVGLRASAFLSEAETAMRRASGTSQPVLCFGCNSSDHLWNACPERSDPDTRARVNALLKSRCGDRRKASPEKQEAAPVGGAGTCLTVAEVLSDPARLGISDTNANKLAVLLNRETTTKTRAKFTLSKKGSKITGGNLPAFLAIAQDETHGIPPFEVVPAEDDQAARSSDDSLVSEEDSVPSPAPRGGPECLNCSSDDESSVVVEDLDTAVVPFFNQLDLRDAFHGVDDTVVLTSVPTDDNQEGGLQGVEDSDEVPEGIQVHHVNVEFTGEQGQPRQGPSERQARTDAILNHMLDNLRAGGFEVLHDSRDREQRQMDRMSREGFGLQQALAPQAQPPVEGQEETPAVPDNHEEQGQQDDHDNEVENGDDAPAALLFPQETHCGADNHGQARALQMLPRQAALAVTRNLPHADVPVGKDEPSFQLKVALDSCAGLNLGHLPFHDALAKLHPQSVAQHINLAETGTTIGVGGIKNQGDGIDITHVITCWIPSQIGGEQARLSFGLSEQVSVTALLGVGFFQASQSILSFSDESQLHVQRIEMSLPVSCEPPSLRTPPTRADASHTHVGSVEEVSDEE